MRIHSFDDRPHWSFSSLNQLLNICSLQWFLQRIEKVKPEFTPLNLVVGSLFHRVLEQAYLARKNNTDFTTDDATGLFSASWEKALDEGGMRFTRLGPDEAAEQGRKLIACALEHLGDEKVLSISEPFTVPVQFRGAYLEQPLVGEFDLVTGTRARPVVVDWKTSATRWSGNQAEKSLQATVYSYAYSQKHRVNPEVRFDVTVKNKTPVFERHCTRRSPDSWERLGALVSKAESIVGHGLFYPAETSFFCGECPYAGACRAWHRSAGVRAA